MSARGFLEGYTSSRSLQKTAGWVNTPLGHSATHDFMQAKGLTREGLTSDAKVKFQKILANYKTKDPEHYVTG